MRVIKSTPRFTYTKWRHGGWYVHGVRYPSGAIGCVAKLDNGRWCIACDARPGDLVTYATREAAAAAEYALAQAESAAP